MQVDSPSTIDRIRQLNDDLRKNLRGGKVLLTQSVACLDDVTRARVIKAIRECEKFDTDNDPHGEHDFVAVDVSDQKYFGKIDYYAHDVQHGSEDPADPKQTVRVLTIMAASDY